MAYNPKISIVDYLTSQGKASDFTSRKRLYESMGLQNTLGEYRGSDVQNPAFLKALQTPAPQPTQVAQTISQPSPVAGQQQQLSSMLQTLKGMQEQVNPAIKPPPLTVGEIAQKQQTELSVPQQFRDLIPPTPQIELTADQILAEARKRPGVQFAEQEAAAQKAALGPAAEAEKERIRQASSERGTTFSPRFFEQPQQKVDAEKISKELNIDMSLARIIANQIEANQQEQQKAMAGQEAVLKKAQEAQKQEEAAKVKELKDYYRAIGYIRNPISGEVEKLPTPEKAAPAPKPPTAAQSTVGGYATRVEQAEPTIQGLEKKIQNMNFVNFETQIRLPAALQNSDVQQYMQVARNFINAVLRRESGAVISDTEFSNAYNQYLPKPGDTSATLALKRQNRATILSSYGKAAGSAYSPLAETGVGGKEPDFTKMTDEELVDWIKNNE